VFEQALAVAEGAGATGWSYIQGIRGRSRIGREELTVLLPDIKADLNKYAATTAARGGDAQR